MSRVRARGCSRRSARSSPLSSRSRSRSARSSRVARSSGTRCSDVRAQADLLAERERQATCCSAARSPAGVPRAARTSASSASRSTGRRRSCRPSARPSCGAERGSTGRSDERRRALLLRRAPGRSGERGFVLLRPTSSTNSAWRPHVGGPARRRARPARARRARSRSCSRARSRVPCGARRRGDARARAEASARAASRSRAPRELASSRARFNEMAEQLAEARDAERQFLLSVSHELKTPLTAIRGYAEGLAEGVLPAGRGGRRRSSREAKRLERLVRDLLDLARMRRKAEFSVRREPIDLGAVARECVDAATRAQAREFGVVARGDVAASRRSRVGDADRTLQVVSNLVENALRARAAPAARCGSSQRPASSQSADDGPGPRSRGAAARVRALLPLLPLRTRAPGRHRARPRDRQGARRGDGRLGRGRERARPRPSSPSASRSRPTAGTPRIPSDARAFYAGFTFREPAPDRAAQRMGRESSNRRRGIR